MKIKKRFNKSNYQKCQDRAVGVLQLPAAPKYLFHGTDEDSAMKSLHEGLLPRMEKAGNWKQFPSNPKCVYLTNCYGAYFALSAAFTKGRRMGIIEIKTTSEMMDNCVPDEDFLEHSTRFGHPYSTEETIERTKRCQLEMMELKGKWHESLIGLGNLCHVGPIDCKRISRVAFLDAEQWRWLLTQSLGFDFRIAVSQHPKNYPKQRALTKWLFGDHVSFRDMLGEHRPTNAERRLLMERRGVEVIANTQDLPLAA